MVILNCNIFGPLVESWLLNKLERTLVIAEMSLRLVSGTSNLMIGSLNPNHLPGGLRVTNVH